METPSQIQGLLWAPVLCAMLLAALMLAPAARADDLSPPPWRGAPGSTFQHWDFSSGPGLPSAPDAGVFNPFGAPLLNVLGVTPGATEWVPLLGSRTAVWRLDSATGGALDIGVPNLFDANRAKLAQIQVTHLDIPPLIDLFGFQRIQASSVTLADGWVHTTELWVSAQVCPDFVDVDVSPVAGDVTAVDQTVVDTRCVGLDHFKVYRSEPFQPPVSSALLADQFLEETVDVLAIEFFANPADKNGEGLVDPLAHQTWYRIASRGPSVPRRVLVTNQFGEATWDVGDPAYLVLPAAKGHCAATGSLCFADADCGAAGPCLYDPPVDPNHFKCYDATGPVADQNVTLRDQFDPVGTAPPGFAILAPRLFCNPVSKNQEPVFDPVHHLACYDLVPSEPTGLLVGAEDQFGRYPLPLIDPSLLCVPSLKTLQPGVDHFKSYEIAPLQIQPISVDLVDQFGPSTATLQEIVGIAAPVDKNGEGILDPAGHQTLYSIFRHAPVPVHRVRIENQFGSEDWIVGGPRILAVPAAKGHCSAPAAAVGMLCATDLDCDPTGAGVCSYQPPAENNHFQCYEVTAPPVAFQVSLEDQFDVMAGNVHDAFAVQPELLCNPVDKNGQGILRPDDHLACYDLQPAVSVGLDAGFADQFGLWDAQIVGSERLCVPSRKTIDCSAAGGDTDGDGICDVDDNCPFFASTDVTDTNGDTIGDVCQCGDQGGTSSQVCDEFAANFGSACLVPADCPGGSCVLRGSGPGTQDGTVNLLDIFAVNDAILNPALVTPLCDTNLDGSCNLLDIFGVNDTILAIKGPICARYPVHPFLP